MQSQPTHRYTFHKLGTQGPLTSYCSPLAYNVNCGLLYRWRKQEKKHVKPFAYVFLAKVCVSLVFSSVHLEGHREKHRAIIEKY